MHSGRIFGAPAPDFSQVSSGRGGGYCTDEYEPLINRSVVYIRAGYGEYVTNKEILPNYKCNECRCFTNCSIKYNMETIICRIMAEKLVDKE